MYLVFRSNLPQANPSSNTPVSNIFGTNGIHITYSYKQKGFKPLMKAVQNGDLKMIDLLLSYGANVQAITEVRFFLYLFIM